jgi:hypothetical protein
MKLGASPRPVEPLARSIGPFVGVQNRARASAVLRAEPKLTLRTSLLIVTG